MRPAILALLPALLGCHPESSKPVDTALEATMQVSGPTVGLLRSDVKRAEDLSYDDIEAMIREAVARAGGFEDIVAGAGVVALKPNLVMGGGGMEPEVNGVDTDWRVARAVAVMVRELAPQSRILVMEAAPGDTAENMRNMNYTHEYIPEVDEFVPMDRTSGGWHEYDAKELVTVEMPDGLTDQIFYANRQYYEADVLISLPTLKTHSATVVTGAIKNVGMGGSPTNIYGSSETVHLRIGTIDHLSVELHQWIRDFYRVRPVDYAIMDGLQGIEFGPSSHDMMNMRLILASPDAIALDTVASLVMGWDPSTIEYIRLLDLDGAGVGDTSRITVDGTTVDRVRQFFQVNDDFLAYGGGEVLDDTPPVVTFGEVGWRGDLLGIEVQADGDTARVEVYLDGTRVGAYDADFETLLVPVPEELVGASALVVQAYDRVLNRTEVTGSVPARR